MKIKLQMDKTIILSAILEKEKNTYSIIIDESNKLSGFYLPLFVDILNGDYSISYVEDNQGKTDTFDFGNPFDNLKEYITTFKGLPIQFIIVDDLIIEKGIEIKDFKYKELSIDCKYLQ